MMNENINNYLEKHYTTKTTKAYEREIAIYLSCHENAQDYNHAQIVHYIGALRNKYSNPKTINRILASIKAYYSFLSNSEYRNDNPAKSIKLRDKQNRDIQLQDLFTSAELEILLTSKTERYPNLETRNKVIISLLIYQALKPQEIEALQCDEINLEEATVYIKASSKNNSRTLALKANQILLFKKYLEEMRPKLLKENSSDKLLIGQRKEPMPAEDITKHIKRAYKDQYKPRTVNAQTIRQSVITNLLKQGHDLRVIQTFAGHKYPSTTEKYKQNNVEALKSAIQIYHPFAN